MCENENKMVRYEYVVSLGYFCSVAMENQRLGMRSMSLPFDWVISSDFKCVLKLLETKFDRFLQAEDLYQESKVNPAYYYDAYNKIHFYHDFFETASLAQQLPNVVEKYHRRIARLYNAIQSPTLFVRYCSDIAEMQYINDEYDAIIRTLKTYNADNNIVFVYDQEFVWREGIGAYFVEPDARDCVARTFLQKNSQLKYFILEHVQQNDRSKNLRKYRQDNRKRIVSKVYKKLFAHFPKMVYVHDKQKED